MSAKDQRRVISSTTIVVQKKKKKDKVSPSPSKTPHTGSEATSSATAATTYLKKGDGKGKPNVLPRAGTRGSKPSSRGAHVKSKGGATVEGA